MRKTLGFLTGLAVALGTGVKLTGGQRQKKSVLAGPAPEPSAGNGGVDLTAQVEEIEVLREELRQIEFRGAGRLTALHQRLSRLETTISEKIASQLSECSAARDAPKLPRIEALERALVEQSEVITRFRAKMLRTDEHLVELLSVLDRLCERVASASPNKSLNAFDDRLKEEIARP